MPNKTLQRMSMNRYVLEGRIVTMGCAGVLPFGAVFVDCGQIVAVASITSDPPAGFEDAPRIDTHGTVYPGLIELHNHLCYNAMPRWKVSTLYKNSGRWRTGDGDYARLIMKPSQVLGGTQGVVEALVRFVECRCLLGGVSTSQGITLSSEPGIAEVFRGLIRNVEKPEDPLPAAGTGIGNPARGKASEYLAKLNKHACYLQHFSEGTDDTARGWFLNLQIESGAWAINDRLCGIHSTALSPEDFRVMAAHGGSMVWSPMSNYLLYGRTAVMKAAKEAGLLIGIGSDWSPSGSKNLLGELKVAWLACQRADQPIFTAKEIVAMATINAAHILKWQNQLGSVEPGKRGDLMVLEGQTDDEYMRVIQASEPHIVLMVIDGVPRVGDERLMRELGLRADDVEEIKVGGVRRWLYLTQQDVHPLMRDLKLGVAIDRLQDALQRLPELAREMDVKSSAGVLLGSVDHTGTSWRMVLDFAEDPVDLALAAEPMGRFVLEPMTLEGITVADDSQYLPNLVGARNLPNSVKTGLPPLYGQKAPMLQGRRI